MAQATKQLTDSSQLTQACPVRLTTNSGKQSSGTVQIQIWSPQYRTRRALKTLGLFWGLSLVTVIIPLLHFVLVPGLFIAGPIVAWVIYRQERMILGGEGICPQCGKAFAIVRAQEHWPLRDVCSHCHEEVRVERLEQS